MPGTKRSGRKRKPLEAKVLEGQFRKYRDGKTPPVTGSFPAAPAHLSDAESALWATFPKPAWIGESDVLAVDGAVSIYERILRNRAAQRATPEAGNPLAFKVTTDGDGNANLEPKENPLITQELKLWGRLFSILATLGLTPADRGKMQAPKVDEAAEDKWAGIL
jgi:phage terminase small subunit